MQHIKNSECFPEHAGAAQDKWTDLVIVYFFNDTVIL